MSMKEIAYALKIYYANANEVEKIIMSCALAAAGASAVGGIIPILEIPALMISCVGAVWMMYIKVCKCLGIKIGENILKFLASAALSNIATNLVSVFAAELLLTFIPGISSIAGAAVTFACVYLAGLMFMKMLLAMAKSGKSGDALASVSKEDFERVMEKQTPTKQEAKNTISMGKNEFRK